MIIHFYCQHVLGVGHLRRALAVADALRGHELTLISGGPEAPLPLPGQIRRLRLPGLRMDQNFSSLFPVDRDADLEDVKRRRREALFALFEQSPPDVFLVELYPFGRRGFAFELDPLLEAVREGRFGAVRTAVSLRDILVEKKKQEKFESWVLDRMNRLFDLLLVHADPRLITLDETFSRAGDIARPVRYSGYVSPPLEPGAGAGKRADLGLAPGERLVSVSAGGGQVGEPLLSAALEALALMDDRSLRLRLFAGPYLPEEEFRTLARRGREIPGAEILRFAPDFPAELAAADASLSMAGYNTTMDLLAAGVPAAVWPFAQNREQRMRAERLEKLGGPAILADADLDPPRLAGVLAGLLAAGRRTGPPPVDLNGAAATARLLEKMAGGAS
ncbi:MAG: glycosyltransferase family protein [Desulfovibrionaceae bacterium]